MPYSQKQLDERYKSVCENIKDAKEYTMEHLKSTIEMNVVAFLIILVRTACLNLVLNLMQLNRLFINVVWQSRMKSPDAYFKTKLQGWLVNMMKSKSPSSHLMVSGYYSMNLCLLSNCFS